MYFLPADLNVILEPPVTALPVVEQVELHQKCFLGKLMNLSKMWFFKILLGECF